MKHISFLLLLLIASSIVISCKDDDSAGPVKTKAEMLVAHDWIISGATFSINGEGTDAYDTYGDCEKDNFFHFTASNHTYSFYENSKVCTPATGTAGTWALNADGTQLTLTPLNGPAQVRNIIELTATSLKATTNARAFGNFVTITESYKAR
ncbi:lipocalin family protein [Hymenobacter lutimineralis]|uniref:Lipocalin family protein n=1 Tax=Hymenobacter lutimineralis TaxID=2606448 RepID=A0A5D6V1E0_9BACT|nr:lipocalin family protein [Hymenobacter lutimineralis]TYZ09300.1 lipocalin family protein [Hymenobacter lutimineralis]